MLAMSEVIAQLGAAPANQKILIWIPASAPNLIEASTVIQTPAIRCAARAFGVVANNQTLANLLANDVANGVYVLTSSSDNQLSYELDGDVKHGYLLFTLSSWISQRLRRPT